MSVIISIHLGTGEQGQVRKQALEALAAKSGFEWNGQPSIGRWLVHLADQFIEERKSSMKEILDTIFENGRVTSDDGQEGLENEFEFEAAERGWSEEEIKAAIKSPWFPSMMRRC